MLEANANFHIEVAKASGNLVFVGILEGLRPAIYWDLNLLVRDPAWRERYRRGHEQIIEGIKDGAPDDRECSPLIRFRTRDRIKIRMSPCGCGLTGPRWTCVGRTDDMLIVRRVNVWASAIADVVGCLRPRTTGAVQILLGAPGPMVDPPLKLQAEYGPEATDLDVLKRELEGLLRGRLVVDCDVDLMPPGTLPRFEMKAQPIRKLYDEPLLSGGG